MGAGEVGVGGERLAEVRECGGVVAGFDELVGDGLVHLGGGGVGKGEVEEGFAGEIGEGAVSGVEDLGVRGEGGFERVDRDGGRGEVVGGGLEFDELEASLFEDLVVAEVRECGLEVGAGGGEIAVTALGKTKQRLELGLRGVECEGGVEVGFGPAGVAGEVEEDTEVGLGVEICGVGGGGGGEFGTGEVRLAGLEVCVSLFEMLDGGGGGLSVEVRLKQAREAKETRAEGVEGTHCRLHHSAS